MDEIDRDALMGFGLVAIIIFVLLGAFFSFGWDTGVMTGTIIGYDTNMFGTKNVFVLEQRTVFGESGMSQSQIVLCSDADDTQIHELIEKNIGKKATIEYKERRVGFYRLSVCHEAPITKITFD